MIKITGSPFAEPDDPHKFDDEPIVIHTTSGRVSPHLILLIHGLTGHRYGYWGNTPKFILEDFPRADVGLYYYRTAFKRFNIFQSIDLDQEARVLADSLRGLRLYNAVTLVGHSMGGMLAKAALADLINRGHRLTLQHVSGLVLLACPQLGSLRVPSILKALSRDGRALFPHNEAIQRIDTTLSARLSIDQAADPLDKFSVPTWAIVAAEDFWVDALSAGIGVPEDQKLTVRGSHGSVVQPPMKTARPYEFMRNCIETSFQPAIGAAENAEEILVEDAFPEEVDIVRKFAISIFGEGVTPLEALLEFARAGGILKVVKRAIANGDERRERFSGYFCLIPLSVGASEAVKAGTLRGGALTMDHVPQDPESTGSLYIGAVAARDHYSRAVVLEGLRLNVNYSAALGIREILTRPLTPDGLRLVRKYRFQPVHGKGGLDQVYLLRAGRPGRTYE